MRKSSPPLISKIIPAIVLLMVFTACDPGQCLVIENKTDAEAAIKFVFTDANGYYDFDESSDSDTLSIQLEAPPGNAIQRYDFGIGTWEINHALDSLVLMVESITIDSRKSTEIFKGDAQIRDFFTSRLSGSHHECIEIIIE